MSDTNSIDTRADLELANQLADVAAAISLSYYQRELKTRNKSDGSLVTEADEAVEDELRAILGRVRPDDAILGEERGETGSGARRWIIDAIDGTVQFAAGIPDWGTLIALEIAGEVVIGVCDQPVHRRRYWATRGGGAYERSPENPQAVKLAVTNGDNLGSARCYLPSLRYLRTERERQIVMELERATKPTPRDNHPALQVALGSYELAVFSGGPWDLAAPAIVVEEAGGRFSDLNGEKTLFSGTAVFSNRVLHEHVLNVVRQFGAEE